MTKREAVEQFVQTRLSPIPTDWVKIVAEKYDQYPTLPMWGTMWFVDSIWGEDLITDKYSSFMDENTPDGFDEEMEGQRCINGTPIYVYEIEGEYLIGVHGAGYNFYDGVWDKLYDLLGLEWHDKQ